ncbi:hypothetical protein [Luteimonas sp. A482]
MTQAAYPLPAERFPEHVAAIRAATTPAELVNAAARFAFATLFVAHATGRACEITRTAVAAEIRSYSRVSKVKNTMPKRFIDTLVMRVDKAAREFAR